MQAVLKALAVDGLSYSAFFADEVVVVWREGFAELEFAFESAQYLLYDTCFFKQLHSAVHACHIDGGQLRYNLGNCQGFVRLS